MALAKIASIRSEKDDAVVQVEAMNTNVGLESVRAERRGRR
jgi:hypothetical protein